MKLKNYETHADFTDKLIFLMKFLESSSQVGSITPSSRFLAEKMVEPIHWDQVKAVAELGAGTGVFTNHINALKSPNCKLAVFEKDEEMRDQLYTSYPDLNYFCDALKLSEKVQSIGMGPLDAVISGLPFALFEESDRDEIIDEVIRSLKPDGIFVAFQYSLQMKSLLKQKFSKVDISFVPLNIPPAFVYVCHKEEVK